jgi:acetaldehyde dehydrogenase / alcohol dehydrogenase
VCLKGRNAVILSPSRLALGVSNAVGVLLQEVLRANDAPEDLVQWISARNSRKTTMAFMKHPGVGMILATGGPALVKAAYSSGNPAIGVGSGNAPTLICGDADVESAAAGIVVSKSFDNGLICGAEHNLVVVEAVYAATKAALEQQGAAVLSPDEVAAFRATAIDATKNKLSGRIIGRSAAEIAARANIVRPYPIRVVVVPTDEVAASNPLATEKMAPVLSLFCVADEEEGLRVSRDLLSFDGAGHTAIIYTHAPELIDRFAAEMPASRILVNSPGTQGVVGLTTGLIPSFTLGCGTFGGTSTTDNVTYTHMLNVKHLAYGRPQVVGEPTPA